MLPKRNEVHRMDANSDITVPILTSEADWRDKRRELLTMEKNLTRQYDAMIAARREMPWLVIDQDYILHDETGTPISFQQLVRDSIDATTGRQRPVFVQHVMYGNDWEEPCSNCSMWLDGYMGILPQASLLMTVVAVCDASPDKIRAVRKAKGWDGTPGGGAGLPVYSAHGSAFNVDMHMSSPSKAAMESGHPMGYNLDADDAPNPFGVTELPGASVFIFHQNKVCLVNTIAGRGLEALSVVWALADYCPRGRQGMNLFPHRESLVMQHGMHNDETTERVQLADE